MPKCKAKTLAGKPCKRNAAAGDIYCTQHKKKQSQRRSKQPQRHLKHSKQPRTKHPIGPASTQRPTGKRITLGNLEIDSKCLSEQLSYYGITIGEHLGHGVAGVAYLTCSGNNCNLVLKIVRLYPPTPDQIAVFDQEVKAQELAASYDIAPRVYGHWICHVNSRAAFSTTPIAAGCILMEKWDDTLRNLLRQKSFGLPWGVLNDFKGRYLHFNKMTGMVHADTHVDNIFVNTKMVPVPGTPGDKVATKLTLGDWGRVERHVIKEDKLARWLTAEDHTPEGYYYILW